MDYVPVARWSLGYLRRHGLEMDTNLLRDRWEYILQYDDGTWTYSVDGFTPNKNLLELFDYGKFTTEMIRRAEDLMEKMYPVLLKVFRGELPPDQDLRLKCECGGDKVNTTHSMWCPKWVDI